MLTSTVQLKVTKRVQECIEIAKKQYPTKTFRMPTITFKTKGRTAGWAHSLSNTVDFNAVLLMNNEDKFIEQTCAHEVAHIIASVVYPRSTAHGPEWKSVMNVLGVPADRCHNYDTKVLGNTYEYQCSCCKKIIQLGPKRHVKMKTNPTAYHHQPCGQMSRLVLASQPKQQTTFTGTTKKGVCIAIMQKYRTSLTRAQMIKMFVQHAGCTEAGASSYYQMLK